MTEALQAKRLGHTIEVTFDTVGRFAQEYKQNILAGGLFVSLEDRPELWTEVTARLLLLGKSIELKGRVVWTNPTGVGIQFEPLTPQQRAQVQILLQPPEVAEGPRATAEQNAPRSQTFKNELFLQNLFVEGERLWHESSLYEVIKQIASSGDTGILAVRGTSPADRFKLSFLRGRLVNSSKYMDSRDVGLILSKEKLLSENKLLQTKEYASKHEVTLREALLQLGFVTAEQIERLVQVRLVKHYAKVLELAAGAYIFKSQPPESYSGSYLLTQVDNLIFRGLHSKIALLAAETVQNLLQDKLDLFPQGVQPAPFLSEQEFKFWQDLAPGSLAVKQLLPRSPFKRLDSYIYLLALMGCGRVRFSAHQAGPSVESILPRIDALVEEFGRQNKFEQLGIHWSHPPEQLPEAFVKRKTAMETFLVEGLPESYRLKVAGMISELEKSHEYLKNPLQRQSYRRQLVDEVQLKSSAQILHQQAQMAIMRNSFREAQRLLNACVDLDPMNSVYNELLRKVAPARK